MDEERGEVEERTDRKGDNVERGGKGSVGDKGSVDGVEGGEGSVDGEVEDGMWITEKMWSMKTLKVKGIRMGKKMKMQIRLETWKMVQRVQMWRVQMW